MKHANAGRGWIAALAILAAACGGRSRARLDVAPCTGQHYLEVSNGLLVPVDVYALVAPQSPYDAPHYVGTARPGTTRFPVSAEPGRTYAQSTESGVGVRHHATGVRFRSVCEP
jgi:hypothetical protein